VTGHAHTWNEVGPRIQVDLTRSQCACGAHRLEVVDPTTGRRFGVALPIGLAKAAILGREAISKGSEAAAMGLRLLEFLEKLRR
jgi:hypothetical protein